MSGTVPPFPHAHALPAIMFNLFFPLLHFYNISAFYVRVFLSFPFLIPTQSTATSTSLLMHIPSVKHSAKHTRHCLYPSRVSAFYPHSEFISQVGITPNNTQRLFKPCLTFQAVTGVLMIKDLRYDAVYIGNYTAIHMC
jgi:hypothetical protein